MMSTPLGFFINADFLLPVTSPVPGRDFDVDTFG